MRNFTHSDLPIYIAATDATINTPAGELRKVTEINSWQN
jgi:hypothetical protein